MTSTPATEALERPWDHTFCLQLREDTHTCPSCPQYSCLENILSCKTGTLLPLKILDIQTWDGRPEVAFKRGQEHPRLWRNGLSAQMPLGRRHRDIPERRYWGLGVGRHQPPSDTYPSTPAAPDLKPTLTQTAPSPAQGHCQGPNPFTDTHRVLFAEKL